LGAETLGQRLDDGVDTVDLDTLPVDLVRSPEVVVPDLGSIGAGPVGGLDVGGQVTLADVDAVIPNEQPQDVKREDLELVKRDVREPAVLCEQGSGRKGAEAYTAMNQVRSCLR
jgi:hypothetical protein